MGRIGSSNTSTPIVGTSLSVSMRPASGSALCASHHSARRRPPPTFTWPAARNHGRHAKQPSNGQRHSRAKSATTAPIRPGPSRRTPPIAPRRAAAPAPDRGAGRASHPVDAQADRAGDQQPDRRRAPHRNPAQRLHRRDPVAPAHGHSTRRQPAAPKPTLTSQRRPRPPRVPAIAGTTLCVPRPRVSPSPVSLLPTRRRPAEAAAMPAGGRRTR